jgi:subtilase family serine protease
VLISHVSFRAATARASLLLLGTGALLLAIDSATAAQAGRMYHRAVCAPIPAGSARCHSEVVTDENGLPLVSLNAPVRGYTPAQLRDAYKIEAMGTSSTIIAAVAALGYDNAESDLAVYRSTFGLPPCTKANHCFRKLNQDGKPRDYPPQDLDWAQDSAIDLEMASAMCPNCRTLLIEANQNSFADLGIAEDTAARLGAHVIVNSYGGDEPGSQQFEHFYDHPGVAVVASSGDRGFVVQFPASSSHVIAVGGTRLSPDDTTLRGWTEAAWANGGSGCSIIYAKPPWQHDSGCANRTIADVAAEADPATGVAIYGPLASGGSGWLEFGGTSVAVPIIGGIYGANGGRTHEGRNLYHHRRALFDVKTGSNGICDPAYLCTAERGYDGPTGNGTPNGMGAFGK